MDYEKKLIEALGNPGTDCEVARWIKATFPGLVESRDEKISRELIEFVKFHAKGHDIIMADGSKVSDVLAWLEEHGKREPVGDMEHSFKPGDIVRHSSYNGLYYRVKSVDLAGRYELECINHTRDYNITAATEEYLSLWAVQDAKAGDVLTNDFNIVFVFKEIKDDVCISYCSIIEREDHIPYSSSEGEVGSASFVRFYPATKEQRDLLFKKIKEAGYEWDAEKKELKKIDQNPAWSEEDENRINRLIAYFEDEESFTAEDDIVYANWLKSLRDRVVPQPKHEWSEEDEKMLDECIIAINSTETHDRDEKYDMNNWLNSLKDRVQPQPQQGWSEEDDNKFWVAVEALEDAYKFEIADWLKSLRPQNRWISIDKEVYVKEPVLAQKKDKSDQFKGYVVCCDHTLVPNIYERFIRLDNNCSYNTWKPSKEQLEALLYSADNIDRIPGYVDNFKQKHLQDLFKQLKKL
jgi:hypothetical protein